MIILGITFKLKKKLNLIPDHMLLNNLLKKIINHSFDFQMNSEMFYFQYKSQMIRPLNRGLP